MKSRTVTTRSTVSSAATRSTSTSRAADPTRATVWSVYVGIVASLVLLSLVLSGCRYVSADPDPDSVIDPKPFLKEELAAYEGDFEDELGRLYSKQDSALAWVGKNEPTRQGRALIDQLRQADREGLQPGAYRLDDIARRMEVAYAQPEAGDTLAVRNAAQLDVALSDAFFRYANHLAEGRIDPETVQGKWHVDDAQRDLTKDLNQAINEGVSTTLDGLAAKHFRYAPLRDALQRYRTVADEGGWTTIPDGAALKKGDSGERVALLRKRLQATGDLDARALQDTALYNDTVMQAMRHFQERHGLEVDGIVHEDDLRALNIPVDQRIAQLSVNLERHRWLPEDLGQDFVFVNLMDFTLNAYRGGEEVLSMPVIVGEKDKQTTAFADSVSYTVFGPYWNVPASITQNEIMPKVEEDPSYIQRNNYEIVTADGEVVGPDQLTEEAVASYAVRVRQKPGPSNALGRVKFMFPNDHNIYLHDTPTDYLFDRTTRTFSHGCIRVEDPAAFAEYVLNTGESTRAWSPNKIRTAMDESTQEHVRLGTPLPVYLVYLTAWADEDGTVHFRDDLYGHDDNLRRAIGPLNDVTRADATIRKTYEALKQPSEQSASSLLSL